MDRGMIGSARPGVVLPQKNIGVISVIWLVKSGGGIDIVNGRSMGSL